MKPRLRRAFRHEMDLARLAYQEGDWQAAFRHLERAHIIGQRFIGPHTLAHWWMLRGGVETQGCPGGPGSVTATGGGITAVTNLGARR